jgi:hypothetical protein
MGARETFAAAAVAAGLTLAGAALTAPAASAQVRPTVATQTSAVTQAEMAAATQPILAAQIATNPKMICGPSYCGSWQYLAYGMYWRYMGPGSPYWKWLRVSSDYSLQACLFSAGGYSLALFVGGEVTWGGLLFYCGFGALTYQLLK